jgi:hypothetical protein
LRRADPLYKGVLASVLTRSRNLRCEAAQGSYKDCRFTDDDDDDDDYGDERQVSEKQTN